MLLLIGPVGYAVLANLFLNIGVVPFLVNVSAEHFEMKYRYAYSFYPGRAHVVGVSIHAQEPDLQWMLEIDNADLQVELNRLFHKNFRTRWVRADGLSFRARPRTPGTPRMPNFDNPDLTGPPAPLPPVAKLWTIELEKIDVTHIRELWMAGYSYQGNGHALGSLFIKPTQLVELAPSSLLLEPGRVMLGESTLLKNFGGRINCAIDRFHPLEEKGIAPLKYIVAGVSLSGDLQGLEFLNDSLNPPMTLSGGKGPIAINLDLVHGAITPKSHFDLPPREMSVDIAGYHAEGMLSLKLMFPESAKQAEARVMLSVEPIRLRRTKSKVVLLTSQGLRAEVRLPHLEILSGLQDVTAKAELLPSVVARVSKLAGLAPKTNVNPRSERGRLEGKVTISPGLQLASGEVHLGIPEIETQVQSVGLSGDLRVNASFSGVPVLAAPSMKRSMFDVEVAIDRLAAKIANYEIHGTLHAFGKRGQNVTNQVTLDVSPVSIWRAGYKQPVVRGPGLRALVSWPKPVMPSFEALKEAAITLELAGAEVPDLSALNEYFPRGTDLKFVSGRGAVHGYFKVNADGTPGNGSLELTADQVHAAYAGMKLRADLKSRIQLSKMSMDKRSFQLEGTSISLDNVSVEGGKDNAANWYAHVQLPRGLLQVSPFAVSGTVNGQFMDARPLLAVFLAKTNLPPFFLPLLRMNGLQVHGDLVMQEATMDVSNFDLKGGPFTVRGRLKMANNVKNGAMLITAGPLTLGIGVKNDKPMLQVAEPDAWYKKQLELARAN